MIEIETELRRLFIAGLSGRADDYQTFLSKVSAELRRFYSRRLVRAGRTVHDVEDLVQETLMAIHSHRASFRVSEPVTPWIYAISKYKFIDYIRRTKTSVLNDPLNTVEEPEAIDDHVAMESTLDLKRMLALLPEKMRLAVEMVKIEGLSIAETAEQVGMSEASVKVNVHRGLKAMSMAIGRK